MIKSEKLIFEYAAYDDAPAVPTLKGLDISIEAGEFVAILGHNGSGKSTLAKHMNALLIPTGGILWVKELDTKDMANTWEIRQSTGMVFQNPDNQIVATVVEEDVAFAPENLGYPPEEIRRRVDESLKAVGMYEYRNHAPHLLSGGQKQRVAIAGVLAMEPKCVVFDEPTAMLDPKGRESIIKVIRNLRDNLGVTVVLITHHMDEAVYADRLIVMSSGEIILDGVPREVFMDDVTLRRAGLDVPETTALIHELRKDGLDIPLSALTVDECADAIYAVINQKGRYKLATTTD